MTGRGDGTDGDGSDGDGTGGDGSGGDGGAGGGGAGRDGLGGDGAAHDGSGDDGPQLPRPPEADEAPSRRAADGRTADSTPLTRPARDRRLDADRRMLESFVCPVSQTPLDYDREAQELISRRAHLAFPIRDGIPILLIAEARQIED